MDMDVRTDEVRWLTPVYVRIGYGLSEAIRSPKQALENLLYRWPPSRDETYEKATLSCAQAMRRPRQCETAREDFIRACIEARLLD